MLRDEEPTRDGGPGTRRSTLGILGAVVLTGRDGPVTVGAAMERCVLGVLALSAGETVHRDRLVDGLWEGVPPRSAVNAAQNYVLRVRRALRCTDGLQIRTEAAGYRLEGPEGWLDAVVAEQTIDRARAAAAAGELARVSALLGVAVDLWRGPTLAEFSDRPFARPEARRLDELRESAREDRMDHELALGRHHTAIGALEPMVVAHPWRERRWAQLILALFRDDRQADALGAFGTLRRTLVDDLGVEPGPGLQTLRDRVLRHDPELRGRASDRPGARPGGPPVHPAGARLRAGDAAGRLGAAAAGHGGLVTVVGEPGIGKTRLLQELEAEVIHHIGTVDAMAHATDSGWETVLDQLDDAFPGNASGRRLWASAAACAARAAARLDRHGDAERLVG